MARATATIQTSAPSSKKKIVWKWQSNLNPWNENETVEWTRYSDLEIQVIEEAYEKNEPKVEVGDYILDFKCMVQMGKGNRNKQRRVKRKEVNAGQYLREERFFYAEKPVKSFESGSYGGSHFIIEWKHRNDSLLDPEVNYPEVVVQAVKGMYLFSLLSSSIYIHFLKVF